MKIEAFARRDGLNLSGADYNQYAQHDYTGGHEGPNSARPICNLNLQVELSRLALELTTSMPSLCSKPAELWGLPTARKNNSISEPSRGLRVKPSVRGETKARASASLLETVPFSVATDKNEERMAIDFMPFLRERKLLEARPDQLEKAAAALVDAAILCRSVRTKQPLSPAIRSVLIEAVLHDPSVTRHLFDQFDQPAAAE
jgi:hypothetical protein